MDFFISHLTFLNVFGDFPYSHLLSKESCTRLLKPTMKKCIDIDRETRTPFRFRTDDIIAPSPERGSALYFYVCILEACIFRSDFEPLAKFFFHRPFRLQTKKWIKNNYTNLIAGRRMTILDFAHRFFKVNDFGDRNYDLIRYVRDNFCDIFMDFSAEILKSMNRHGVFRCVDHDKISFDFYLQNSDKFIDVFGSTAFPPRKIPDDADEKIIMSGKFEEPRIIELLMKCHITDFIQIIRTAKLHGKKMVVEHYSNLVASKIQQDALRYKEEIDDRIAELKKAMG